MISRNFFLNFLLILHVIWAVEGNCIYTINGPGVIRSNYNYNVAISLHQAEEPCKLEVGITSLTYNATQTIEMNPMSTKSLQFDIPHLENGIYKLIAKDVSTRQTTFVKSVNLDFAQYKPLIFIQTDKAIYKPGDLVQFRILILDHNTRPAILKETLKILLLDGASNYIKQILDIKLTKGVYTGSIQLSEHAVLGDWELKLNAANETLKTKSFEVKKYMLPRFDVIIDTAENVVASDGVIQLTVQSKYTFGKPVKGEATILLWPDESVDYTDESPLIENVIEVNGKGNTELNLQEYLSNIAEEQEDVIFTNTKFQILVIMKEDLTDYQQNATTTITLHEHNTIIRAINAPEKYRIGVPIIYTVAVLNLDGTPVLDSDNFIYLTVDDYKFETHIDCKGMATFNFTLTDELQLAVVYAIYLEHKEEFAPISYVYNTEDDAPIIQLILDVEKPRLGEEFSIEVASSGEPWSYFVYTITARGQIVKAEYIHMGDNQKIYTLNITTTFEMIPKATIFVQFIQNNTLHFAEEVIHFETGYENTLELTATNEAKPGDDIEIQISTQPDSFVGLLAVDKSVLLLKSGNDLNENELFDILNSYDTHTPKKFIDRRYPGKLSGLVTLTNAYVEPLKIHGEADGPIPPFAVRKEFPETWIFADFDNIGPNGHKLVKKIPDTITTWVVSGFSINPKTGIALTRQPMEIKTLMPLFITVDLPYAVKKGESVSIPVTIFNYMQQNLDDVEVVLENPDDAFELLTADEYMNEVSTNDELDTFTENKHLFIASNSANRTSFNIKPKKFGAIKLKITALTPYESDSIEKVLRVEPDGKTEYRNHAYHIYRNYDEIVHLDIPLNAIEDSEYIQISAIGQSIGIILENIDDLVRLPKGCGEQNMINFVPNILALKYLQSINQTNPMIEKKAHTYLEKGYQSELRYRHNDGSFSVWAGDKRGSTWLTTYVARYFQMAKAFIYINAKHITMALDFLAKQQLLDGSFQELGYLYMFDKKNKYALTSFAILAFQEEKQTNAKYKEVIEKGLAYLTANMDVNQDIYALSIAALVLQKAKSPRANELLNRLLAIANNENVHKWWSSKSKRIDVEITSYVLLAILESESKENVLPIVNWLIEQRNSKGGFVSTQDTVVGLQALSKFAEIQELNHAGNIEIQYTTEGFEGSAEGTFNINSTNSLILQTHVLPKNTRKVKFTSQGNGVSLVQLSYQYNIGEKIESPYFKLNMTKHANVPKLESTTIKPNRNKRAEIPPCLLHLEICLNFTKPKYEDEIEGLDLMPVMELQLPSGFAADDLNIFNERIQNVEFENQNTLIILYFDTLTVSEVICMPIKATLVKEVVNQRPVPITVYDYYNNDLKTIEYYVVNVMFNTHTCEV